MSLAGRHRAVCAVLATALSLLATGCGGSEGGSAPDCPVPTSSSEPAAVPDSCEEDPGGLGY